jgi:hypothetical protein
MPRGCYALTFGLRTFAVTRSAIDESAARTKRERTRTSSEVHNTLYMSLTGDYRLGRHAV